MTAEGAGEGAGGPRSPGAIGGGAGRREERDVLDGQPVELEAGVSSDVVSTVVKERDGKDWDEWRVTITNAKPYPVNAEIEISNLGTVGAQGIGRRLSERDGRALWRVRVPANGSSSLRYRWKTRD